MTEEAFKERKVPVKVKKVTAFCMECRKGKYQYTHDRGGHPVAYYHRCDNCYNVLVLDTIYPLFEYEEISF